MELLLDHTSLHSLRKLDPNDNIDNRLCSLCHLVDQILLADRIYITDTENEETLEASEALVAETRVAGASSHVIQVEKITDYELGQAIRTGAETAKAFLMPNGYDFKINLESLLSKKRAKCDILRPSKTPPRKFKSFIKVARHVGSPESQDLIECGIKNKGFESTASVLLFDEELFDFVTRLCGKYTNPLDSVFELLNAHLRLAINMQLAEVLSEKVVKGGTRAEASVRYSPSYGRSLLVAPSGFTPRGSFYVQFNEKLWKLVMQLVDERGGPAGLLESAAARLPLLGLNYIASFPEKCGRKNFLSCLLQERELEPYAALRVLLSRMDVDDDPSEIVSEIESLLSQRKGSKAALSLSAKAQLTLFSPSPLRISIDAPLKLDRRTFRDLFLRVPRKQAQAVLINAVARSVSRRNLHDYACKRVKSILNGSP